MFEVCTPKSSASHSPENNLHWYWRCCPPNSTVQHSLVQTRSRHFFRHSPRVSIFPASIDFPENNPPQVDFGIDNKNYWRTTLVNSSFVGFSFFSTFLNSGVAVPQARDGLSRTYICLPRAKYKVFSPSYGSMSLTQHLLVFSSYTIAKQPDVTTHY